MRAWDDRSIEILASAHYEAMLADLKWADAAPLVRTEARRRMRAAVAALDAAGPLTLTARLVSGESVTLSWVDKHDSVPGFDENNNRFEAYTVAWWFTLGSDRHSGYSQADRWTAECSGDVPRYRALCEIASLRRAGVEPESMFVPTQPGIDTAHFLYDVKMIAEADAKEKVAA